MLHGQEGGGEKVWKLAGSGTAARIAARKCPAVIRARRAVFEPC